MALIIPLPRDADQCDSAADDLHRADTVTTTTPARDVRVAAEVIIFPGVRYERWVDAEEDDDRSKGNTQCSNSMPRDWLEI